MGSKIENYQANTTQLMFARMVEPVHATNCTFYLLNENGNAKNVVL